MSENDWVFLPKGNVWFNPVSGGVIDADDMPDELKPEGTEQ